MIAAGKNGNGSGRRIARPGAGLTAEIVSRSRAMARTEYLAELAAKSESVVLITGETGAGKDHLARWIHEHSSRAAHPFFAVNCAALARTLAESELFGHEAGAYTGASEAKPGLLEVAGEGTLLLNEIGDLDLSIQAKLLDFMDSRTVIRVGGTRPTRVSARLLAATNRNLKDLVRAGRFREDLYYRIHVFPVRIPPLRHRLGDLPLLAEHLLQGLARELGREQVPELTVDALKTLATHPWEGNIRELRNVLHRSMVVAGNGKLDSGDLQIHELGDPRPRLRESDLRIQTELAEGELMVLTSGNLNLHDAARNLKKQLIERALLSHKTQHLAAEALGISRYSLLHQMKSLGIEGTNGKARKVEG